MTLVATRLPPGLPRSLPVNLSGQHMRIGFREWATRKLHAGDLTALAAISGGLNVDETRLKRLQRRGFLSPRHDGRVAVTVRGHMALAIKRLTLL